MIVRSRQFWKKTLLCHLFETDAQFNLLLTVNSDINGVLFALINPVFVPYIRFIS
jgi:hypothetical protein